MKKLGKKELVNMFLPYYINKSRLLDIYSILNGGYEEYIEITSSDLEEKGANKKIGANASIGFNLINIGGEASLEKSYNKSKSVQINRKKVQTLTSMTDIVIKEMRNKGILVPFSLDIKDGYFVETNVNFIKNSVKGTIEELIDLMKLLKNIDPKQKTTNYKQLTAIGDIFPEDYGIELVSEYDDYAIVGYAKWENLYQSNPYDIINNELLCLCQIKNIFSDGTELLKHSFVPDTN